MMLRTLLFLNIIVGLSLIGSTVIVELTRQGVQRQFGESLVTEGLKITYDTLCKVTGYVFTPYYILFWELPKWIITNLPIWIENLRIFAEWFWENIIVWYWNLYWNWVFETIQWIWENIIVRIVNWINWITKKVQWFWENIIVWYWNIFWNWVVEKVEWLWENVVLRAWKWFWENVVLRAWYWVKKFIMEFVEWFWRDVVLVTLKRIWHWAKYGWDLLKWLFITYVWGSIQAVWAVITNFSGQVLKTITTILTTTYNAITTIVINTYETIANIVHQTYTVITEIVSKTYDSIIQTMWNVYQTILGVDRHDKHI